MQFGYKAVLNGKEYAGRFAGESATMQGLPGVSLRLHTQADTATGVSRRRLAVVNEGDSPLDVQQAHLCYYLAFPHAHLEYFTSDWGSEYTPVGLDVTYPVTIGTWHGRSSKGCAPFFTVGWQNALGEAQGLLGVSVGWSGNWQADIRRLDGENMVTAGLALTNPTGEGLAGEPFCTTVPPGGQFDNIELFDCYRDDYDAEALSFSFRSYYKNHIRLLADGMDSVPVIYNHWWPYEDKWINEDVFLQDAIVAKELGCTNTLLDAGWFGPSEVPDEGGDMPWFLKRGDWDMVNSTLFPSGIAALSQKVRAQAGLPFGIWCEIEAVGKEARLIEARPELMARQNGKVLDYVCMGNPATRQWALDIFKRLIEEYGASWIKIDFNLDPQSCDCEEHGHGKGDGLWAHYQGLYAFMDEVRRRWPHVVLENCSSGGLRTDYGIMQHCHYCFLSDPDFTPHHLQCFWGVTSHIHPSACYHFTQSEIVGGHNIAYTDAGRGQVEQRPITADTSTARLDYMTRACMTGVMGFSHKLAQLPPAALARLKEHIAYYRGYAREYLLDGDFYRLTGQTLAVYGKGETWCAFQLLAKAGKSLMFVLKSHGGQAEARIRLKGLDANTRYTLASQNTGATHTATGAALMTEGLLFASQDKEYSDILEVNPV